MEPRRAIAAAALVALALPLAVRGPPPPAAAAPAVRVWDGGAGDTGWTSAANWVGDDAPVAGDVLEFPHAYPARLTENDFPAGTTFSTLRVAGFNALTGAPVVVTSEVAATGTDITLDLPLRLGGDVTVSSTFGFNGGVSLSGGVALDGHRLTLAGAGFIGIGPVSGAGPSPAVVVATTDVSIPPTTAGSSSFTGGTRIDSGTLVVRAGDRWPGQVRLDGGTLQASGYATVEAIGNGPGGGALRAFGFSGLRSGSLSLAPGPVSFPVDGLQVTGAVSLGGATLSAPTAWCGAPCSFGRQHQLVTNDGDDPVVGRFAGLPQGARFEAAGVPLEINYYGGDGNDIVLRVREPGPPEAPAGYWMLDADGDVYPFGTAADFGALLGIDAVGIAPRPAGDGYWVVDAWGEVFPFGGAQDLGGLPPLRRDEEVSSISAHPTGRGYWLFTTSGRVFAYGAADDFGDMGGVALNGPVLGSVATPSGEGYYMVASDGGIFAFGDARFAGSMGGAALNAPVMGLAPDPDGVGYWLVAADGGVFAFDAAFRGSMGDTALNAPVIGMTAYGDGYLLVALDGGIFSYSDQPFVGSLGGWPLPHPIIAVAPVPD